MKKVCNICREEKELCDFGMNNTYKSGVSNRCEQCESERGRKYNKEHKEQKRLSAKKYKENNRDKMKSHRNSYLKIKRQEDIIFKLKESVRRRLYKYLKTKSIVKNKRTFDIVGCSPPELKEHLEKQFVDGMSWDNYGKWHIDHIIPLSSAKTEDEICKLGYYTNLQPLWAEDNLRKGDKITPKQIVARCQDIIRDAGM
jgi:hypothetical protein